MGWNGAPEAASSCGRPSSHRTRRPAGGGIHCGRPERRPCVGAFAGAWLVKCRNVEVPSFHESRPRCGEEPSSCHRQRSHQKHGVSVLSRSCPKSWRNANELACPDVGGIRVVHERHHYLGLAKGLDYYRRRNDALPELLGNGAMTRLLPNEIAFRADGVGNAQRARGDLDPALQDAPGLLPAAPAGSRAYPVAGEAKVGRLSAPHGSPWPSETVGGILIAEAVHAGRCGVR